MHFDNRYIELNSHLYHEQMVDGLPDAKGGHFNQALAQSLQWSAAEQRDWVDIINGRLVPDGAHPLAMVYAGHQFGQWAGQLGDGRGVLIGQIRDQNDHLIDLHCKGAGRTPYSRGGDGRAVLRSVIREYLAGHALSSLGIRSSQAIGFIYSDTLKVQREQPEKAAILLRTSDCHIRFGHFEWINAYAPHLIAEFFEHCLTCYYPEARSSEQPIVAFADAVITRTARLIADWQLVGFAHGVMNTDNLNITGSTLDFGPYGFMERFEPHWINNHSDTAGRYTYQNQPTIAHWNLWILLNNLLPLAPHYQIEIEPLKQRLADSLHCFEEQFIQFYQQGLIAKIGLSVSEAQPEQQQDDFQLALSFLQILADEQLDYTTSFRQLTEQREHELIANCRQKTEIEAFLQRYRERHNRRCYALMSQHNPIYILRNHMAQQAIAQAEQGDFSEVQRLFTLLTHPYTYQFDLHRDSDLAPLALDQQPVMVSCSS